MYRCTRSFLDFPLKSPILRRTFCYKPCVSLLGGSGMGLTNEEGTFPYIPFAGLQSMTEGFRHHVIKLQVEHQLLNENVARNFLSWNHSGFNIDSSVQMLDNTSQKSPAEYIVRPSVSLEKIHYEPFKGRVLFHTTDLFALLQAKPSYVQSSRLSPRSHPTHPAERLAAHSLGRPLRIADEGALEKCHGSPSEPRKDRKRLRAQAKVIAFVENLETIKRILRHPLTNGRSPSGFDLDRLNGSFPVWHSWETCAHFSP